MDKKKINKLIAKQLETYKELINKLSGKELRLFIKYDSVTTKYINELI